MNQTNLHYLEPLFHPESIAVVGASPEGNAGYDFVRKIQAFGFKGTIYPVNQKAAPVLGLTGYNSVSAIPGKVDYVIFAVPASAVPAIMEECVEKGVKLAHLFTARLGETGVEELVALEQRIVQIARRGNIRILGSNGMGLYYPKEGISFRANYPKDPGDVGFISQSGGNAWEFVYRAALRGIRFSKVISYGNACDLNATDYLDYLADDTETSIITAYIEGVRDGRQFFASLKKAASMKPVIILKGGRTVAGARATASHTASLAGDHLVWEGLLRQARVLQAESIEEMEDLVTAVRLFPKPRVRPDGRGRHTMGRSVAVFGGGGGGSVAAADICYQVGLNMAELPADIMEELQRLIPATWMMISNPIDGSAIGNPSAAGRLQEMIFRHQAYDFVIVELGVDTGLEEERSQAGFHRTTGTIISLQEETKLPTAVIVRSGDATEEWRRQAVHRERDRLVQAGLPVFPSFERAARALSKVIRYWADNDPRLGGDIED